MRSVIEIDAEIAEVKEYCKEKLRLLRKEKRLVIEVAEFKAMKAASEEQ